jgi:hypothetical protein
MAVSGDEYAQLTGGAYDIVWNLVFQRITRRFEIKRGHPACAISVQRLEPECLDRFQDDVEAVLDDLLRNAKVPIMNLDGWITRRLTAATVNAHRRRRGERGALQRPRLPGWLSNALGHDAWLKVLAVEILTWVGVPTTAGVGAWPTNAWADLRANVTGDFRSGENDVINDVETVLAAMRRSSTWYASFVERPLGRKETPVLPAPRTDVDLTREPPQLALTGPDGAHEAHMSELASHAVAEIEAGLRRGEPARSAVVAVLQTVFGCGSGADDLGRAPHDDPDDSERVTALLANPATIERVTAAVLDILGMDWRTGAKPTSTRPSRTCTGHAVRAARDAGRRDLDPAMAVRAVHRGTLGPEVDQVPWLPGYAVIENKAWPTRRTGRRCAFRAGERDHHGAGVRARHVLLAS